MKRRFKFHPATGRLNIKISKIVLTLSVSLLCVIAVFIFVKAFSSSLFFKSKDRINIVFYGKNSVYYSFGLRDGVHYFISFYPDVKVKVPGGYGSYRVGGLGKLVLLENKSDLFRKTFSVTTASTVDRFFYNDTPEIYYGKNEFDENTLALPGIKNILLSKSNSSIFDRIYISLLFFGKQKKHFTEIDYKSSLGIDEEFFQDKDFAKKYQGFLYNATYRKEQKAVQIVYKSSYKTALFLSKIIEGDGIRVVDLQENDDGGGGKCRIIENGELFSQSSSYLSQFFGCSLEHGVAASSDIIIQLRDTEKDWEIL